MKTDVQYTFKWEVAKSWQVGEPLQDLWPVKLNERKTGNKSYWLLMANMVPPWVQVQNSENADVLNGWPLMDQNLWSKHFSARKASTYWLMLAPNFIGELMTNLLMRWAYSVIHLLVVDVSCVLFWDHAHWLGPKQNARNIYHKQMNNGVCTEIGKKVWLFAKLQPGRARKRINAT